jgi:hypothetical protein
LERFEEAVAGGVEASALAAIVDGDLAVDDVGKERDVMDMPAGLAARRDGDDRRRYIRRAGWIGDGLADDRLIAGKNGGEERLILARLGGAALGGSRHGGQRQSQKRGRTGHTQLEHHGTPDRYREKPRVPDKGRRSG